MGRERRAEPLSRSTGARRGRGVARPAYKLVSGFDATVNLEVYMGMRYDLGGCLHCRISFLFPGRSPVRARTEALHRRNSPPTHQIRDVMAAAGFTTHSMQVMQRKRFVPRCPSTQAAAGVKSTYGRLMASERMLDGRVWGQGEPGSSRIRRARGVLAIVLARGRSLGAIECERACTASRATTGAQLGSG